MMAAQLGLFFILICCCASNVEFEKYSEISKPMSMNIRTFEFMLIDLLDTHYDTHSGTCSYLLGNAGTHAYNGNPPRNLQPKKRHCSGVSSIQTSIMSMFARSSNSEVPSANPRYQSATPSNANTQSRISEASTNTSIPDTSCHATDFERDFSDLSSRLNDVHVNLSDIETDNECDAKVKDKTNTKSKKTYLQNFLGQWFDKHPSIKQWCQRSYKGGAFALCIVCNKHLKIDKGGIKDLLKHPESQQHKMNIQASKNQIDMKKTYVSTPFQDKVTNAEILWSAFVSEHQLSFKISDHATKLFQIMFPDSKIAQEFRCGRTKTRNILTKSIAPSIENKVVDSIKTSSFSLLTDDSTDITVKQQCCVLVKYFDESCGTVKTMFYKLMNVAGATGLHIYDSITQSLNSDNIPLNNLLALGTDSANTMIGKVKGLYGRLLKTQEHLYSSWCICHRLHLVAKKSVKGLPKDIQELPVLIYYWFKKSPKRCKAFEAMQDFNKVIEHRLLKPSDTRWLSMHQISDRLSEQWPALQSYFNSLPTDFEIDSTGAKRKVDKLTREKIVTIRSMLDKDINRMCFLFLKGFLKRFTVFNTFFQTSKPVAYKVIDKLNGLMNDLLVCFVKPDIINANKSDFCSINMDDPTVLLSTSDFCFGDSKLFDIMGNLTDTGNEEITNQFILLVKKTYISSVIELKKMPFHDRVLINLKALNPHLQGVKSVRSNFMDIATMFPNVIPKDDLTTLDSELRKYDTSYQLENINKSCEIDNFWWQIVKVKEDDELCFPLLYRLAKALLCIPHGNAESEQIFSRLKLTKTKYRSAMNGDSLNALLCVNFNMNCDCYMFSSLINKEMRYSVQHPCKSVVSVTSQNNISLNCEESDFETISDEETEQIQLITGKRVRKPKHNPDFVYQ